ncbi:hypothetical protein H206_06313 [Candidatus Electrothrix aarhusensis]|uniref:Uncharacterized protein n=1 Tax=Candidatus Electrothrix aarhusensis TaxID=1859131 RepID=A0A444J363_9BACT|nr:hypothetical protein H206_06313 [Candidatus Electrothrix aarhusensis]
MFGGGGLDHGGAAVAFAHSMIVIFDLIQEALLFEILDDLLPAGKTVHACVFPGLLIHDAVVVHDLDPFQIVAQADFIVVPVMGRGDLEGTGPEFPLDMMIQHHRDNPIRQRQVDADFF